MDKMVVIKGKVIICGFVFIFGFFMGYMSAKSNRFKEKD